MKQYLLLVDEETRCPYSGKIRAYVIRAENKIDARIQICEEFRIIDCIELDADGEGMTAAEIYG